MGMSAFQSYPYSDARVPLPAKGRLNLLINLPQYGNGFPENPSEGEALYSAGQCHAGICSAVLCCAVFCSEMQFYAVICSAMQFYAVLCSAMQYYAGKCNAMQ